MKDISIKAKLKDMVYKLLKMFLSMQESGKIICSMEKGMYTLMMEGDALVNLRIIKWMEMESSQCIMKMGNWSISMLASLKKEKDTEKEYLLLKKMYKEKKSGQMVKNKMHQRLTYIIILYNQSNFIFEYPLLYIIYI